MMKLLLIGGTGVLSRAVVCEAIKNNIDVTIVNRGNRNVSLPKEVHVIKADYRNKEVMLNLLKGLHFDSVIDFICFNKDQIAYSIELLAPLTDQYVFISSACVYNTEIPGVKYEYSEKVLPSWDYSKNKWECEEFLRKKASQQNIRYTIIRPCITYDDSRIPYGIMPPYGYHWTLIARMLAQKSIIRWDGGIAKWNMMRVEDFAVGLVGLIGNSLAINEAFNICGDVAYSWNDVVACISRIIEVEPIFTDISSSDYQKYFPQKQGEISGRAFDAVVNNEKIKKAVPYFKTSLSLEDGIRKTIEAYKKQGFQRGIDWRFDANCDRIVNSERKKHPLEKSNEQQFFVDYLGTASKKDKLTYWTEYNRDNVVIHLLGRMLKFIVRLKTRLFK